MSDGAARAPAESARGRSRVTYVADLSQRALARMQDLASAYAQGQTPWGPDRGIVTRETAVDAVMDVFATVDALRNGVELPPGRLLHTFSALMAIREYVVPLPSLEGDEELLRQDLAEYRDAMHRARRELGFPD